MLWTFLRRRSVRSASLAIACHFGSSGSGNHSRHDSFRFVPMESDSEQEDWTAALAEQCDGDIEHGTDDEDRENEER